jgi:glycosyltransferase involved in cell wall biosynthesis
VETRSTGAPHISVITPLFNCLEHTQAMLASLREAMPPGVSHEIILVDDCSTDGTREWLAGLGDPVRVILNERNVGFSSTTTSCFAGDGSGRCWRPFRASGLRPDSWGTSS